MYNIKNVKAVPELYYKFLYYKDDKWQSYLINEKPHLSGQLFNYDMKRWNYPKFGKLFVFDSVDLALNWFNPKHPLCSNITVGLFTCKVKKPSKIQLQLGVANSVEDYQNFWNNKHSGFAFKTFTGTTVVEGLKVLERVTDEYMLEHLKKGKRLS